MKRNDNRGASFVMVVVAMAIVAVLAVTVLWIALMNLQMKVTERKKYRQLLLGRGCAGSDMYRSAGRYFQGLLSRIYKGYGELL